MVKTGDLAQRSLDDYAATCKLLIPHSTIPGNRDGVPPMNQFPDQDWIWLAKELHRAA
jgi:hypothetical protein